MTIEVIRDGIQLCTDCLMIAVNGDASSLDYVYGEEESAARLADIEAGLTALGCGLVPDFDSETGHGIREFSNCGCDCCGSRLAGTFHQFAILGEPKSCT